MAKSSKNAAPPTTGRRSMWPRIWRGLLTGWAGVGHVRQARELWPLATKFGLAAMLLIASLSVSRGLWLLAIGLSVAALVLATLAYFVERPGRPYVRCRIIGVAVGMQPDGKPLAALLLRLTNTGKPTALQKWAATAILAGSRYDLTIEQSKKKGFVFRGERVNLLPDTAIVHATLQPVGAGVVTGYLAGKTIELTAADLTSAATDFEVRCEDSWGKVWTFKGLEPGYIATEPPAIAGLTE